MNLLEIQVDPKRLKSARGPRSGADVARQIGISRQQLWNYENGFAPIPSDVLARLCLLYKIEITNLTERA